MVYAIASIVIFSAFMFHMLILLLKKFERDSVYNENISFSGGMGVGDGLMDYRLELLDDGRCYADTVIKGDGDKRGLVTPVTGQFQAIMVRIMNVYDGSYNDYPLDHQLIIGREGTGLADVIARYYDSNMSAKHCKLYRQGNQIYIQDLGSTNHTYVNSCLLEGSVPCNTGDIVQMGNTIVKLFLFN